MGSLRHPRRSFLRFLAHRRAGRLAHEAVLVLRERNQAPLCSLERMALTARAMELNCLSCAAAAEAAGDDEMVIEHRVEAGFFGQRARLHAALGTPV
jgi:alkylhydroperoxidase family enzyme